MSDESQLSSLPYNIYGPVTLTAEAQVDYLRLLYLAIALIFGVVFVFLAVRFFNKKSAVDPKIVQYQNMNELLNRKEVRRDYIEDLSKEFKRYIAIVFSIPALEMTAFQLEEPLKSCIQDHGEEIYLFLVWAENVVYSEKKQLQSAEVEKWVQNLRVWLDVLSRSYEEVSK